MYEIKSDDDAITCCFPKPFLNPDSKTTPEQFIDRIDTNKRVYIYKRTQGNVRHIKQQAERILKFIKSNKEDHVAHEKEIYKKLVEALACILFIFIGAPLGALIRKGGFGWPILVSIIFFLIYFILGMVGERLAKRLVWECWMGCWLSLLILFPMSLGLMYSALNDINILSADRFKLLFSKSGDFFAMITNFFKKK